MYWYSSQVLFLPRNCSSVQRETDYLKMDFVTFCEWLGYLCNANGRCHYVHEVEVNQVSATAYADDPALQVTLRLARSLNC